MTTPTKPFDAVVLRAEVVLNQQTINVQEALSADLWSAHSPASQEVIKRGVRQRLGEAIVTKLDVPVTVTREEQQVMTTSGAAPGHGGSVRVNSPVREAPSAGGPVEYQGSLIIVWSRPGVQVGESVVLLDADTGARIDSALKMRLTASPREVVTAELLMLVDEQGAPLPVGAGPVLVGDEAEVRTAVFRWLVVGMRAGTDVGTEFVQQADRPDPAGLAAWEEDLDREPGEVVDVPRVTVGPDGQGVVLHLPDFTSLDTQVWAVDIGLTDEAFQELRELLLTPSGERGSETRTAEETERLERGRVQLVGAMSAVSVEQNGLWWVDGLDRRLYGEGGMWETLGRAYGWPVGGYGRAVWMSWEAAGAQYTGRAPADR
ncbi:hypothetical protein AB0958_18980 [Streptomyces sp. NPDC006655]|uniref:hypothetical protein n=1 Tax=Streptomyces sp. NPDC006655 TaxID=3156898 RepID=UPI0034520B7B